MLTKLKKVFRQEVDPHEGTKIIVNYEKLETRVALLEDGSLEEYNIERDDAENIVGSIFKGRVKNIEPGLKAMFVDIGFEKNAFLHFWDAIPAALDSEMEEIDRKGGNKGKKQQKRITSKDIPDIYPVGSEVMVQVTKGPIGTKGPRVTTRISLPGKFMVLMPLNDQWGISRKIDDPKERKRLREIMEKLSVPEGMGIIFRTVSAGRRNRYFVRDLGFLLEQWTRIAEIRDTQKAPVCCFEEPDLVERTVRDFLTDDVGEVICDDQETSERMRNLVGTISRRSRKRIHDYDSPAPIFDELGVQKQIDDAFYRQVWLPCGGYLVIDETEAMIAVDVNTGRNKGGKNVEKTILTTNIEAAHEVARQLRLRNIGGLIVVDFIDMRGRRDQQAVYRAMCERVKRDKAKTQVLPISRLGLMEMTRQRLHESLNDTLYESCPACNGHGKVKSAVTMSVELQRRITGILARHETRNHDLLIVVHPDVMHRLRTEDEQLLAELQRRHQGRLTFRADQGFTREQIQILDAKTNNEIRH